MTSAKLEQGAVCETTQVYKIYSHAGNIQLHSQPAQWERSHQANWEHSQLAWSEDYTIYNAASCSVTDLKSVIKHPEICPEIYFLTRSYNTCNTILVT